MAAAVMGDGFHEVCATTAITARRTLLRVPDTPDGRYVALISHNGKMHCIDATCYHMGGPLLTSDIEDIPGHGPCIVCPWHHYQISLEKGIKLYMGIDRTYQTTGDVKQRVHEVAVRDGKVWIKLSTDGSVASDEYAYKKPAPSQNVTVRSLPRSGFIHGGGAPPPCFSNPRPQVQPGASQEVNINRMISNSMRGGDGTAPWAMPGIVGGGAVPPQRRGPPASMLRGGSGGAQLPAASRPAPSQPAANRRPTTQFATVTNKTVLSASHFTLTVSIPAIAGLLKGEGKHVNVAVSGADGPRPYTPYVDATCGKHDMKFYIKVYPTGTASNALADLNDGDAFPLEFPALLGGFPLGFMTPAVTEIAMVAGGTGIAVMLQVLYHLIRCKEGAAKDACGMENVTAVSVLLSNRGVQDVALLPVLSALAKSTAVDVSITHTLTKPSSGGGNDAIPAGQTQCMGQVDEALLQRVARAGATSGVKKLLVCGPPGFNEAVRDLADGIGHRQEDVFLYA